MEFLISFDTANADDRADLQRLLLSRDLVPRPDDVPPAGDTGAAFQADGLVIDDAAADAPTLGTVAAGAEARDEAVIAGMAADGLIDGVPDFGHAGAPPECIAGTCKHRVHQLPTGN